MVLRTMSIVHGSAIFICFGAYFVFTSDASKISIQLKCLSTVFLAALSRLQCFVWRDRL